MYWARTGLGLGLVSWYSACKPVQSWESWRGTEPAAVGVPHLAAARQDPSAGRSSGPRHVGGDSWGGAGGGSSPWPQLHAGEPGSIAGRVSSSPCCRGHTCAGELPSSDPQTRKHGARGAPRPRPRCGMSMRPPCAPASTRQLSAPRSSGTQKLLAAQRCK